MESVNVNFDEYTKVYEAEPMKEPEEYKSFLYSYEGMHVEEDVANQATNQQQVLVTTNSQTINVELHLGTKLDSYVKL